MKIQEILKENFGFKGEYTEPYVHLLGEMCIVVSLMLDKGHNIDTAIKKAIHEFNEDLLIFDVSVEKAKLDLMHERGDFLTTDGYSNQSGSESPITEISKGAGWTDDDVSDFKLKLSDPAAYELNEIANTLNKTGSRGYSFNSYNEDKELGTIIGIPPRMDIETEEGNLVENIKGLISKSRHWAFKAFRGDVEQEFAVYVVRK
jgi:hypothetical protein